MYLRFSPPLSIFFITSCRILRNNERKKRCYLVFRFLEPVFLSLSPVQLRRYMPSSLPLHSLSQHMWCWRAEQLSLPRPTCWKFGLQWYRRPGTDLSPFSRVENGSWNITPIRSLLALKPFYVVMERGTPLPPHTYTLPAYPVLQKRGSWARPTYRAGPLPAHNGTADPHNHTVPGAILRFAHENEFVLRTVFPPIKLFFSQRIKKCKESGPLVCHISARTCCSSY